MSTRIYLFNNEKMHGCKPMKDVAPGLLQKSVVLETAHIIRRVMDS